MVLEQQMWKPLPSHLHCFTDNMYFCHSSWHLFMKFCTEFSVLWKKHRVIVPCGNKQKLCWHGLGSFYLATHKKKTSWLELVIKFSTEWCNTGTKTYCVEKVEFRLGFSKNFCVGFGVFFVVVLLLVWVFFQRKRKLFYLIPAYQVGNLSTSTSERKIKYSPPPFGI